MNRFGFTLIESLTSIALLAIAVNLLFYMKQSPQQSISIQNRAQKICQSHAHALKERRTSPISGMDTVEQGQSFHVADSLYSRHPLMCVKTTVKFKQFSKAELFQCLTP